MKQEILTEDIINKCKEYENTAREEIFNRLDQSIENDLPLLIAERVFFWFVDNNNIYEEPIFDDIYDVVELNYLNSI